MATWYHVMIKYPEGPWLEINNPDRADGRWLDKNPQEVVTQVQRRIPELRCENHLFLSIPQHRFHLTRAGRRVNRPYV